MNIFRLESKAQVYFKEEKTMANKKKFYEVETKKELTAIYQEVKKELLEHHRKIAHFTKKELYLIFQATKSGEWEKVHETKLYNDYGGEYCSILQILCYLYPDSYTN